MINRDGTDFRGTGEDGAAEGEQQDQQNGGQDLIAFHGYSSLRSVGTVLCTFTLYDAREREKFHKKHLKIVYIFMGKKEDSV